MFMRPVEVWNKMISEYVSFGDVRSARQLFEAMPERDVVSWNSMISGAYADTGDLKAARRFFEKMPHRNVVSWNTMISSYTKQGKFVEASNLFVQMHSEDVIPDGYTFVAVLSACSNLGDLEYGKYIHYLIGDLSQWEVMKSRLKPNDFTFTSALFACSHGGMVEQGRRIFYRMEKDYKISPKIEHFGCFIDLLSRNGQLEEAMLLVNNMPFEPDIAIWGALLGVAAQEMI
ncbi:hypothetical protein GH714_027244 [Hevea brasiliensis]|uniref:Pentacotripeptide-repeat region of PRORP domain-containing protein n=1 Tax=Hevea brasiliensis TaxID=3981 RepID=A0A6A6N791_HEVBR|nr:hypothetical protein GH714_027244 [Hevea brasiliensis]